MKKLRLFVVGMSWLALTATSTQAGWHEFWNRCHLDFHRNNCWPEPFESVDRAATREPFAAMVTNGWRKETTLGDAFFHPESQKLTEGGMHRVHWILTQVPEQHRTVHVSVGFHPTDIEKRIDSVQTTIAQLMPGQQMPQVLATNIRYRQASGEYVNQIDTKTVETIPEPRLKPFQAAGSAGN
ncbi:MAG: hypothetical protein KDB27_00870 [Planctomycetales bacterium]|nr:hypothetical protein [Planctomycetales bacterium]